MVANSGKSSNRTSDSGSTKDSSESSSRRSVCTSCVVSSSCKSISNYNIKHF